MRMMSPDGTLGQIPDDKVAEALAAGFREMTDDDMKLMFNRISLEHALFKDQRKKALANLQKRTVTRMRGRR